MRSEFFGRVHFLSHTLSICLSLFFSASSVFIILVMTRAGDAFLFLFWLLLCWLRRRRRRRPPPFHFNDFFFGWVIFTFLLIWLIFIFSFFLSFFLSVSLFFISVLSLLPHFIESFFLSFFIFFSLLVYVFGSWINGELPTLWWDDFRSRWALIDSSNLGTAPLSKENNPSSTLSASFSSSVLGSPMQGILLFNSHILLQWNLIFVFLFLFFFVFETRFLVAFLFPHLMNKGCLRRRGASMKTDDLGCFVLFCPYLLHECPFICIESISRGCFELFASSSHLQWFQWMIQCALFIEKYFVFHQIISWWWWDNDAFNSWWIEHDIIWFVMKTRGFNSQWSRRQW